MRANVELNGASGNCHVAELSWGEQLPASIRAEEMNVVLAADCVYFEVSQRNAETRLCHGHNPRLNGRHEPPRLLDWRFKVLEWC